MINEKLINKSIITASMTSDVKRTTTGDYTLTSLTQLSKKGNKFTINGGTIKIGKGVKKVLAMGNAVIQTSSTSGIRNMGVKKNNSNVKVSSLFMQNSSTWTYLSIPPILIDVDENDTIGMQVYTMANDTIKGGSSYTYLTVIQVE